MFDLAKTPLKSITQQYEYFIHLLAGQHIGSEYCYYLEDILKKNHLELTQVNNQSLHM